MTRKSRVQIHRASTMLIQASLIGLIGIVVGCLGMIPAQALPEDNPESLGALVAQVAEANQQLHNLGDQIAQEKESVNKAIVDLQEARERADRANHDLAQAQEALQHLDEQIALTQQQANRLAVARYTSGPAQGYLVATNPEEMLTKTAISQGFATRTQYLLAQLHDQRSQQALRYQQVQQAKDHADQSMRQAQNAQQAAIDALENTQHQFAHQQDQIHQLARQRDQAQARLQAAQAHSTSPGTSSSVKKPHPNSSSHDRWNNPHTNQSPSPQANTWAGEWDPTLPMIPSANVVGDPIVVINRLLGISQTSAQLTANMGQRFLQSVGLLKPGQRDPGAGITNGRIPRVYGQQASEYVIRRGLSQRGVPYSWGGGNAAGPSRGIGSGAGTVGFDCSGLILYSFAGVGIKLPHYSGAQYKLGRKIPAAMMRRGDVIFYGPGGSQHVTLYLGNGMMLEAPDVGQTVKVSPVRRGGMTPYVVRYIEY